MAAILGVYPRTSGCKAMKKAVSAPLVGDHLRSGRHRDCLSLLGALFRSRLWGGSFWLPFHFGIFVFCLSFHLLWFNCVWLCCCNLWKQGLILNEKYCGRQRKCHVHASTSLALWKAVSACTPVRLKGGLRCQLLQAGLGSALCGLIYAL